MNQPPATRQLSFVQAVKEHGDAWGNAFWESKVSAATKIALSDGRHPPEWKDALRMRLCETSDERLFQVERPIYRCGCDGLCPNHPACPGVVYDKDFPYVR